MTQRLYHADAYVKTFDANVLSVTTHDGTPALVLDATHFYPEAGGQLGDRGTIGGATITDTQQLDDGTILHLFTGDAPTGRATAAIDWVRRRQHMAQHTAQHLLSGALLDRAQAATQSARLGESALTIDVTRDRIPDAELAKAEDLANDLIDDDLAVRAWFPAPDELAQLELRRDPKVDADIRVVAIGDFDFSPCGGTHVARTSQISTIRITGSERYKGMTRVTFAAGRRARGELFARDAVLRTLATRFSCAPGEVPAAIDKLARDSEALKADATAMRGRLAGLVAGAFPGTGAVVASVPGDAELVRQVAAKLVAAGRDALLTTPDGTVVLFRAAGSTLDCGGLFKQLSGTFGGRGGGKAERAEGRLANPPADWAEALGPLLR